MSKNMTRKSLALGAGLALVSSVFTGLPSQANAALTLAPLEGTEYGQFEGETFKLIVTGNDAFQSSNGSQIRFLVENEQNDSSFSAFAINDVVLDDNYTDGNAEYRATNSTGNSIKYTGLSTGTAAKLADGNDGTTAVLGLGADTDTLGASSTSLMTVPATLAFTNTTVAAGANEGLIVTAFADLNNNGTLDAGETRSNTVTVKFYDEASPLVVPSASATLFAGDNTFVVSVSYGVINEAQLSATDVGVRVLNSVPATPDTGVANGLYGSNALALNASKTAWRVTVDHEPTTNSTKENLVAGATFTAEPLWESGGSVAITDNPFTAVTPSSRATFTVLARTVNMTNTVTNVVPSANATITTSGSGANVRRNSSFDVAVTVRDGATTPAALPGVATSASVSTTANLNATRFLTINGTAYTSAAALAAASLTGSTNASGISSLTIVPTGFARGETVTVTFTVQGTADTSVVATLVEPTYSANFVAGNEAANAGYDPTIAVGGSYTVSYAVADQFGQVPANGTYSLSITRAQTAGSAARTTDAAWSLLAPVVDGIATVTIRDNGTGAGSDTVTAAVIGSDAGNSAVFDLRYGTVAISNLTLTDNWTGGTDSTVRINSRSVPSWHPYLSKGLAAPTVTNNFVTGALTGTSNATLTLSGTALTASNAGVEGTPVTLAAKGLTFAFTDAAGGVIYSRDSITVPTNSSGAYSVFAYSDATGGTVTITATSGTLTQSLSVEFAAGSVSDFTITVPASTQPGRTADVIISAKDANGNPVQGATVTLSSTGPGYLINTSGTTLSDGTFSTKLLLGANDSGTAVVRATMTRAGVSTTKTAEIRVGSGAAAGAGKVNVGSFNGKLVVYASGLQGSTISWKVGGNWGKGVASSSYSIFNRPTPRAGVTVSVDVYVNGVKTLTKSVVTR